MLQCSIDDAELTLQCTSLCGFDDRDVRLKSIAAKINGGVEERAIRSELGQHSFCILRDAFQSSGYGE